MIPVTQETYFDLDNRVLTRSKIKDFYIDKNYFYRKHVLGEIKPKPKKHFLIGSIVDELLTLIETKDKYIVISGDGRTKAVKDAKKQAEADGYLVVSESDYDMIFNMASAVEQTDAYRQIVEDGYIKQGILQVERKIGDHFDSLASMIDFYKIEGGKCTIVDLKTTQDIDPERYHWNAIKFWYYLQMSINTILFRALHPNIEEFEYYNLVVDKTEDIYKTEVFQLANTRVEQGVKELEYIIDDLSKEKEFNKHNPSLDDPILIGEMVEY